ncbi:MAG TPA: hypothetical protein VMC02_04585 [Steroidobacteraceae bacterium]|nr:hypothetical protein [Steroidobacteraceae bacterium]
MLRPCRLLVVLLLTVSGGTVQRVAAEGTAPQSVTDCAPSAGLRYICGPVASEDLVRIPHSDWLIASGMNVGRPAHLYLIDTARKSSAVLFPDGSAAAPAAPPAAGCDGPPDPARMSTDGLALRPGAHGLHTLYAANHGDRMAIEIFEINAGGPRPVARWIGCARLPPGTLPNAVTTLPDGGLLVISFHDPTDPQAFARMARGENTGRILEWHPERGFSDVADGATSGGNGIATSADGTLIYASSWSARRLVVLSRKHGSRREIPLDFMPDNIHRLADGSLLVGGQRTTVAAIQACTGARCPQPWVIARVQPQSGRIEPLLAANGSEAINYACGAVALKGTLYITARGDQRIAYLPIRGRPYRDLP